LGREYNILIKQTDIAKAWGVSKQRINHLVKRGLPLTSIEEAEEWKRKYMEVRDNVPKKVKIRGAKIPPPPKISAPPSELINDRGIEGVLARAIEEEIGAYSLVTRAFDAEEHAQLPVALRAHREAQKNRMEAQDRVEDARLRNKETIKMDDAKAVFSGVLNQIRADLLNAPSVLCSKLDPTRAEHARRVVDEWVQGMMENISLGNSQLEK
jgi:hypothetical protein